MTTTSRDTGRRRLPRWLLGGALAVLLVVGGAAVLRNRDSGDAGGVTVEEAGGQRWQVELSASPAEVPPGEPVTIVLTVRNDAESLGSLTFPTGRQMEMRVVDADGNEVWRAPDDPPTFRLTRSVSPGASVEYRRTWETDGSEPGRYRVEATVLADEVRQRATVRRDVVVAPSP